MIHHSFKTQNIAWLMGWAVACAATMNGWAQTELWGEAGEAWDPKGILPDFSFAGYQRGEKPIPTRTPEVTTGADVGIQPESDITVALQKVIDDNPGKCIAIPAGRYVLSERIRINQSGTVLQGAGPEKTILHFTRGLQEIEPTKATTGGGMETTQWSWSGGLMMVGASGIESASKHSITSESTRGDRTVTIESSEGLEPGDNVQIEMWDDDEGTLTSYLYRGDPGDDKVMRSHASARQIARVVSIEGNVLTVDRPLRYDIRSAWSPTLVKHMPKVEECGLEGVTIDFPARPYRGHWMEDGFNGVSIKGSNNWVRNIRIHNSDSGVYMHGQFNTVDGVTVTADREPHDSGNTGHHGLTSTGQDCLITRFQVETQFFHDLTIDKGSTGNVFSAGSGVDLCFDHHRYAPYENLFTDIDLGEGTRPWASGGAGGKGRNTAAGATFWNIDSKDRFPLPKEDFGPAGLVFVGLNSDTVRRSDLREGWHFEKQRPGQFEPANLHLAQLKKRLVSSAPSGNTPGSGPAPAPNPGQFHQWTNLEGNTIEAQFLGLSETAVKLGLKNGQTYDYPLSKLTADSQAQAKRMGSATQ